MSWTQRRGQPSPNPAGIPPNVQMYNPNQDNQQPQNNWYAQQQPPIQQQQQQAYWQQPGNYAQQTQQPQYSNNVQQYQQPNYYQQPNPVYQQQQQTTPEQQQQQQGYNNMQYNTQYAQNNVAYPPAQSASQPTEADAWGNWGTGWGDEDNSNLQNPAVVAPNVQGIEKSFANDESWNWGVEETKPQVEIQQQQTSPEELFPKMGKLAQNIKQEPLSPPENKSLDLLSASGKRGKLETPQWSVESQMSQESSDDVLHTSESDNHLLSRSSTVSHSPVSGQEPLPLNKEEPDEKPQFENKEVLSTQPPSNQTTPPLMPPPMSAPPMSMSADNMTFKRQGGLSHKSANRFRQTTTTPAMLPPPSTHFSQSVNLETVPDNSEHPDLQLNHVPVPSATVVPPKSSPGSVVQSQWQENNEAPINDRNQYLETGELSDHTASSHQQVQEDALPPPGLRRMVLGQIEQNPDNSSGFYDEPPPGLSRMVLGQTEATSNVPTNNDATFNPIDPPEGLRRMIPGESSSPESSRQQPYQSHDRVTPGEESEPEFSQIGSHRAQPRSATIGADTPPADLAPPTPRSSQTPPTIGVTNRSETIGGDTMQSKSTTSDKPRSKGNSTSSNGSNRKKDAKSDGNRSDFIEGQPQDSDITPLISSVRNLRVGENSNKEYHPESTADNRKKRSTHESSDSDREHREKSPYDHRDRRYADDKKDRYLDHRKERERYTPESHREKRHERRRPKDRYEEDTDYFSDKEKDRRRERDRENERKYYSLRKDKDKDKDPRRRGPRDYGRDPRESGRDPRETGRDPRRGDYYYGRYEDTAYDAEKSRPSSRSDSMHDSFRGDRGHERDPKDKRHRDRDRDRYRKARHPFDPYSQAPSYGHGFDQYNQYYQQQYQYQQYYENLRRTNPQAYAEWYRKYYQGVAPSFGDDRASVHSGRSSANEEIAKDRYARQNQSYYGNTSMPQMGSYYQRDAQAHSISGQFNHDDSSFTTRPFDATDSSLNFDDTSVTTAPQRLTPAKFATTHIKASITSGKLIKIPPHYAVDGNPASVEIISLEHLLYNDDEYKELTMFPGPLIKGTTHKKTIIAYCENKIKNAVHCAYDVEDAESYVLMWELMILLLRQNGMVVGTDIAELLLKNRKEIMPRPSSVLSSISSNAVDATPVSETSNQPLSDATNGSSQSILKEEEVTNKFREYLLYGSGKEALEWAMKHGLWGHALFLASKLDKRTYANVMMRFANGLTLNDPLQTLYQLLSGKMPAAVTCVSDEKWGDWRPHLAMILSNSTQRPDLNRKAITSLGDTLMTRGSLFAAQFCYLMAEVGFGQYGSTEAKLILLGSNHNQPFGHFATNEAMHMTEVYEYACSLNDSAFIIPEFQAYKYLLATRLADRGLLEKSLAYLEKISQFIVSNPAAVKSSLVNNVCRLADKLKYYDPVGDAPEEESQFGVDLDTSRPDNSWLKDLRSIQDDFNTGAILQNNHINQYNQVVEQESLQQTTNTDANSGLSYNQDPPDVWQQQQEPEMYDIMYQQQQQQIWQPEVVDQTQQVNNFVQNDRQQVDGFTSEPQQQYWQNQQPQWGEQTLTNTETIDQNHQNYYGSNNAQIEDVPRPQISMPNQSQGKKSAFLDEPLPSEKQTKQASPAKTAGLQDKPAAGTGWFGGIFSKLSLKGKNQMKLPDDKNPSIVWDQEKKRWINVDEDNNESVSELKAPPKMSDLMPKMAPAPAQMPPPGSFPNPMHPIQQQQQPLVVSNMHVNAPPVNPVSYSSVNPVNNSLVNPVSPMMPSVDPGVNNMMSGISNNVVYNANIGVPAGERKAVPEDGQNRPAQTNMFKMQRSRNLKKSYVDVFNPSGNTQAKPQAPVPNMAAFPGQPANASMNFFVPQVDPNAPTDFLTVAPPPIQQETAQPNQ